MYTQCPECGNVLTITVDQLRQERAIMYCPECAVKFDALEKLSEKRPFTRPERYRKLALDSAKDQLNMASSSLLENMLQEQKKGLNPFTRKGFSSRKPVDIDEKKRSSGAQDTATVLNARLKDRKQRYQHTAAVSRFWLSATLTVVLLFILQIYFFAGERLLQNKKLRPVLENTCALIKCQLKPYKNLLELKIVQGSFKPITDESYQLQAVFANNSAFDQSYPAIKMELMKMDGKIIASRTFLPEEYLQAHLKKTLIPGNEMVEISMDVVPPDGIIGGYRLELL